MKTTQEIDVLEGFLRKLLADKTLGTSKWISENELEFTKGKTKLGSVILNDKEMTAKGKEVKKAVQELIDILNKKVITQEDVDKSVFKQVLTKPEYFNGLNKNIKVFQNLSALFNEIGVKEVRVGEQLNKSNSICKEVTLAFDLPISSELAKSPPSGFASRLKTILFSKVKHALKEESEIPLNDNFYQIGAFPKEKCQDIKLEGIEIGQYLVERNLIYLYFNPFKMDKILPITDKIGETVEAVINAIKEINPKQVDTAEFEKNLFINSFLLGSQNKLKSLKANIEDTASSIKTYEKSLQGQFENYNNLKEEVLFILRNLETGGKGMYEELEKVKKLPFVDNMKIEGDSFTITFKPTTLRVPNFNRGSTTKQFGRVTMYLGKIGIKIQPGKFSVICEPGLDFEGHPHPHGSSSGGSPCFGDGDGRKKIYELLSSNKFEELTKILFFWVKTFKNEGAYIKHWEMYDDRLRKGIPMWDKNGNRIELGDKDRLKSSEQRQVDKASCYEANIKKFKDLKCF
jgi:hypothetical protein